MVGQLTGGVWMTTFLFSCRRCFSLCFCTDELFQEEGTFRGKSIYVLVFFCVGRATSWLKITMPLLVAWSHLQQFSSLFLFLLTYLSVKNKREEKRKTSTEKVLVGKLGVDIFCSLFFFHIIVPHGCGCHLRCTKLLFLLQTGCFLRWIMWRGYSMQF